MSDSVNEKLEILKGLSSNLYSKILKAVDKKVSQVYLRRTESRGDGLGCYYPDCELYEIGKQPDLPSDEWWSFGCFDDGRFKCIMVAPDSQVQDDIAFLQGCEYEGDNEPSYSEVEVQTSKQKMIDLHKLCSEVEGVFIGSKDRTNDDELNDLIASHKLCERIFDRPWKHFSNEVQQVIDELPEIIDVDENLPEGCSPIKRLNDRLNCLVESYGEIGTTEGWDLIYKAFEAGRHFERFQTPPEVSRIASEGLAQVLQKFGRGKGQKGKLKEWQKEAKKLWLDHPEKSASQTADYLVENELGVLRRGQMYKRKNEDEDFTCPRRNFLDVIRAFRKRIKKVDGF